MRCRYCNKAISLLRRLNDAEYCTDAHRFADAAEQQLAMQRLAETQPAMQRTQRMAAAKPGRFAVGEQLPFKPPVIQSGWQPKPVQEPLHVASTVLFMDRQYRYQAAMPWGADSVPVPMSAAFATRVPAAVLGQLAQMRIVIPRGLTSRLFQRDGWSATPPVVLAALALQAQETQRPDVLAPKPEPVFDLKWLRHPHRRRDPELVPSSRLSSLSMSPASPEARAFGAKASEDPLFQPTGACIPVSRLAAAAPPKPVRKEDTEEFWTLLEASPLGALLSATHYPTISPAAPAVGERGVSEQPRPSAFPGLAAVCPRSPRTIGSRQPDATFGLKTARPVLPAAGRQASFRVGGWCSPRLAERFPVAIFSIRSLSLIAAPGGPIPEPEAAGARATPNVSEAWFPAVLAARQPASRVAKGRNGIRAGGPVDCDLSPVPVDSVRRPYFQQTLQTTVSGTDLSSNTVFPLRAKRAHDKALRHIPVRLFQVPRAKPAARPGAGKPHVIGMDPWASPPAIRAPRVPFDDGKPRVRRESTHRLAEQLRERFSSDGLRGAWAKVSRLPSDLKWIAMVVPLILGIWVLARPVSSEPARGHIPVSQETAAAEPESHAAVTPVSEPPVHEKAAVEPTRWEILNARVASRASVDLIEDFHNGLSQWEGRGEWARTWSYDRSGTVRPGQMAIFQPTIALKDYTVEMKASIEKRSIQWVVRASGPLNYHFARLNVTPGAPLTKLEFERWTVVNGRTGRVTRLPLPHGGANQTLYTIRLEVNGGSITTYLQDQVIDTFSDPRLPEGGVGLLGAHDDRARIYGLHVSHQNDFLGKLCSLLAPPPINNQRSD